MKNNDTTSVQAHGHMRTLMSSMCSEREYNLAEQFRIHLVGIYHSCVGPEWDSGGKLESDYLHHIDVSLTGKRNVILNDQTYELNPGEAWFLPGNTPVARRCSEDCEVLFFKFYCGYLAGVDPLLDWKGREPRRICSVDVADWSKWLNMENQIGLANILKLRGCLMCWLAEAIPEIDETISDHLASHARFSKVFQYIEKNLGADLRLVDLATIHGTSPEAFAAAFTRSTGISPKEYLKRCLNQEAIRLVMNSDLKMKQIAEMLRFNDEFYFSRFFQRLNGCPPLRYRNMFQLRRS